MLNEFTKGLVLMHNNIRPKNTSGKYTTTRQHTKANDVFLQDEEKPDKWSNKNIIPQSLTFQYQDGS